MSDIKSTYDYDPETGLFTRRDSQNIDAHLEQNRAERLSGENEQRGKEARKFASVSLVILEDLKQRLGIDYMLFGVDPDHTGRLLAWLQDPANQGFRTSEAKLGNANRFLQ